MSSAVVSPSILRLTFVRHPRLLIHRPRHFLCQRHFSVSASSDDVHRPVRVRFAPSPTGNLHVGGARTALFNYLFAR
ncbi:hypothetical protein MLD38_013303 [Melastoma candidum]|uniref:Uncharacterized protein n=1 Tax=Melastoma candidum TaxID=119954 RepID=A0ACB9RDB4_9MYRT|nr:hypothetical protein MLD38_013303 [Melastoma candidum]